MKTRIITLYLWFFLSIGLSGGTLTIGPFSTEAQCNQVKNDYLFLVTQSNNPISGITSSFEK